MARETDIQMVALRGDQNPPDERGTVVLLVVAESGQTSALTINVN